jgi:hypothetical protein
MQIEISIDLETFSSAPNASIAAIGATCGDGDDFYAVVHDPEGAWDPATIRWHTQQKEPARNVGDNRHASVLCDALIFFSRWLERRGANREGAARLWTHATFDMPVLESAYRRADLKIPWHYRNCRDLRTLYDFAGGRPTLDPVGAGHHALDDAKYQLNEVMHCLRIINGESA